MGKRRHDSPDVGNSRPSKARRRLQVSPSETESVPTQCATPQKPAAKGRLSQQITPRKSPRKHTSYQSPARKSPRKHTSYQSPARKSPHKLVSTDNGIILRRSPRKQAPVKSFYGNTSVKQRFNSKESGRPGPNKKTNKSGKKRLSVKSPVLGTPGFQKTCAKKPRVSPRVAKKPVRKQPAVQVEVQDTEDTNTEEVEEEQNVPKNDETNPPKSANKFFKNKTKSRVGPAHVVVKKGFNLSFKAAKDSQKKKQKRVKKPLPFVSQISKVQPIDKENLSTVGMPDTKVITPDILTPPIKSPQKSPMKALQAHSSSPKASPLSSADSVLLMSEAGYDAQSSPGRGSSVSEGIRSSPRRPTSSGGNNPVEKLKKLFPIFTPPGTPSSTSSVLSKLSNGDRANSLQMNSAKRSPKLLRQLKAKDGKEQLMLDVGQRLAGTTQCEECGLTYMEGDPTDEATHSKFHHRVKSALKFPGWKNERVLQEFDDGSRIIVIMPEESQRMKKVAAVKQVMDEDLGFVSDSRINRANSKIFLYISSEKKIVGCCVAEHITQAYRVIVNTSSSQSSVASGAKAWCCSDEPEPAKCGINRIWVLASERRNKIATKLLECVRYNFFFGFPLDVENLAFTDPTPNGKSFATKYTGTPAFLVYKYN